MPSIRDRCSARRETARCLTAPQAEALARVYAGPRTRDGRRVGHEFPPGGETGPGGWGLWINGEAPGRSVQAMFAAGFGANMVFGRPDWDPLTFDVDRDLPIAREKARPRLLDATDPDLEPFRSRGGKLILFHGWNDAAIPAGLTIDYVDAVAPARRRPTELVPAPLPRARAAALRRGPGASDCNGLNAASGDARHDLDGSREVGGGGRAPGR
ncbi:MAG: tannase/feruloyl esterase family alpha/beta hydrolase [Vicinamibacteria bacterium]